MSKVIRQLLWYWLRRLIGNYPANSWFLPSQKREKPLQGTVQSFELTAVHCHPLVFVLQYSVENCSKKFNLLFWLLCLRTFSKNSEDSWRLPKTFQEDPKMFWSYTNKIKYNLTDKLDISDIFTSEDIENMPLESRM